MGKNSGKRRSKQVQRPVNTKNVKNLEVSTTAAEELGREFSPQPPDEYFDDEDYNPEISMGAASPVIMQNPTLKLIGTPTSGRPQLVEIKKQDTEVHAQAHAQTEPCQRTTSNGSQSSRRFDDLQDEFKNMLEELEDRPQMPAVPSVRPVLLDSTASPETSPASTASTAHSELTPPRVREIPSLKVEAPELEISDLRKNLKSAKKNTATEEARDPEVAREVQLQRERDAEKAREAKLAQEAKESHAREATQKADLDALAEQEARAQKSKEAAAKEAAAREAKEAEAKEAAAKEAAAKEAAAKEAAAKEAAAKEAAAKEAAAKEAAAKEAAAKKAASKEVAAIPSAKETGSAKTSGKEAIAQPEQKAARPSTAPSIPTIRQVVEPTRESPSAVPKSAPASLPQNLKNDDLIVGVAVVGFHHTRGPEVEYWIGPNGNQSHLWPYLPFQSLPDGSHSFEENICYFTVLYDPSTGTAPNPTPEKNEEGLIIEQSNFNNVETLFGISCTRQIQASELPENAEITRSNVQKGLVVLARKPVFGPIKEKLKVVTRTYFDQLDFEDRRIIDNLYENVQHIFSEPGNHSEGDFLVGTNPRELVHKFGPQAMVLFKALLLEKKIAFYASDTERLCTAQFSLVSLIPDLLNNLQDCGSPLLSTYETRLTKPTFLRTSDRSSLLKFLGFPLQVFAAGGMFAPFVPLQLVDELKQPEMQYGMFGSTNRVFFSQGIDYDVFVDVDNFKVTVEQPELRKVLDLTSADKTFFNAVACSVKNTWDEENTEQPTSLGYEGSEDFIRHSFEDYLIGLLSSAKYQQHLEKQQPQQQQGLFSRGYPSNPLKPFGLAWVQAWLQTNNYRIFNKFTDEELFDIVEPSHVALLKNKKRTDAIAEVRGVLKSPQMHAPPSPNMSSRLFSMFGWASSEHAPPQMPSSSASTPQGSPKIESPKVGSPRKRFFWG